MRLIISCLIIVALLISTGAQATATSIVNSQDEQSLAISSDDGSNTASFGGPVGSSSNVFIANYVSLAWKNAGIETNWLPQRNWNNTFAHVGKLRNVKAFAGGSRDEVLPLLPQDDFINLTTNESQAGLPEGNFAEASSAIYTVPVDPGLLFWPDGGDIAPPGAQLNSSAFALFESDFIPSDQQQYWQLVAAVFVPEFGNTLGLPPSSLGIGFKGSTCWPSGKDSTVPAECKSDPLNLEDDDQSLVRDFLPERIAIAVSHLDLTSNLRLKTLALFGLAAPVVLLARRRRAVVRPLVRRSRRTSSRRELIGKCA